MNSLELIEQTVRLMNDNKKHNDAVMDVITNVFKKEIIAANIQGQLEVIAGTGLGTTDENLALEYYNITFNKI